VYKRILLLCGVALVAFAGGVFVGYKFLLLPRLWMGAVGESFLATQYTTTQYREASYRDAKQALEAYIVYLDNTRPTSKSWQPGESPWLDERGLRVDKTLAWSRLAVLHERNNNPSAAVVAWDHAEALAKQGTWRDPSRNHLRELIERSDRASQTAPSR
jgi:hypothetical protein